MKLRYYAAVVTEIAVGLLIAVWMGVFTQKDILEIAFVMMLFSPLSGMAVLAATETDRPARKSLKEMLLEEDEKFPVFPKQEDHHGRKRA